MKHAFLITAYTDASQLKCLIDTLDSESSVFYIHLDSKSPLKKDDEITGLRSRKNVIFLKDPISVHWGGYSHLKALLLLLHQAAKDSTIEYFHALSGQDHPLRPIKEIQEYFNEYRGRSFLSFAKLDDMHWSGGSYFRLRFYHLNDWFNIRVKFWKRINARWLQVQRLLKISRQLPAIFSTWYGGGTWWSLHRNAVEYTIETIKKYPELLRSFRNTHCSEEIFFQTILCNSPLKDTLVNNDLRYVDWSTRDGHCPAILDERDIQPIRKSEKIFGRKFVSGISDQLRKLIT